MQYQFIEGEIARVVSNNEYHSKVRKIRLDNFFLFLTLRGIFYKLSIEEFHLKFRNKV